MDISPDVAVLVGDLDFDPATLKSKYLSERDKRVRTDGNNQYIEVKAEFSHYIDDPYVEPGFKREPVFDEVEFAIIGGGFGGLFRRNVVLEPLSRRDVRCGIVLLPAAAGRARLHAEAQILLRAGDPGAQ